MARANALQVKTSQGADADAARIRALAAYKDFLTLRKDADPGIPHPEVSQVRVCEAELKLLLETFFLSDATLRNCRACGSAMSRSPSPPSSISISILIGAFCDAYGVCDVRGDGARYFRQP